VPDLPAELLRKAEAVADRLDIAVEGDLLRLLALSDFAARVAGQQPEWLAQAAASGQFEKAVDLSAFQQHLDEALAGADAMEALQQALRRLRNQVQFHQVWRHCLRRAPLEETVSTLSAVADRFIHGTLQRLEGWAAERDELPLGRRSGEPQHLCVLALGKLGAQELNLSSDIDLILVYDEPGANARGVTCQQLFTRLAQQLVQALDALTADGFVYRVDLRLRPFGGSGPLAMAGDAFEAYYASHGRDWERYALQKARPCAGDRALGERLLEALQPFVYRRYLDFGALDALRDLKARLVAQRQDPNDLKLGPGGIRDVEFAVQLRQLIWAGREPALRTPRLVEAMSALLAAGHLDVGEADGLGAAYRLLRDAEHSLQAQGDEQTQTLPDSALARSRLALSLGFADYDRFAETLRGHRDYVAQHFSELLADSAADGPDPGDGMRLWHAAEALAGSPPGDDLGPPWDRFEDPEAAAEALTGLVAARDRSEVGAESRRRLDRLMPTLLDRLLARSDRDQGLLRLAPVIRAVLRRSAYLALLYENPEALDELLGLTASSRWLASELARRPAFFDALLSPSEDVLPSRADLVEELSRDLSLRAPEGTLEAAMDVLRDFKEHHVFAVALAELRGRLSLMHVSDYLTWLAEAVLERALTLAWADCADRFPEFAEARDFLIVGFGKLGGIELGPDSDLDIVFVHDLPASAAQFLHRLVRRILHILTVPTYLGTLYEVDMRLRPSGNAGTLVTRLDAFRDYEFDRAWVWEHQALVRARPVAGDARLAERFLAVRREVLAQPRNRAALAADVLRMRRRISAHHGTGTAADEALGEPAAPSAREPDLKRGSGGIVDIEFLVQYLVLAWAARYPRLTEHSDNMRILDAVAAAGLLPEDAVRRLQDAYLALRAEWHRSVLDLPDDSRAAALRDSHRHCVAELWQQAFREPGAEPY